VWALESFLIQSRKSSATSVKNGDERIRSNKKKASEHADLHRSTTLSRNNDVERN
jgi:hypothetical protein